MIQIVKTTLPPFVAPNPHILTLTFASGEIALFLVIGANSPDEAHVIAREALPCDFTIQDGDQSDRHAEYYYLYAFQEESR